MTGRALGPGKLRLERRGRGPGQWTLDYRGSDGRRRREQLGADKRVAERMRADLITKRDLERAGFASIESQSRPLAEVIAAYINDLTSRASESHVRSTRTALDRLMREVGRIRVRDLKPHHLLAMRSKLLAGGASNRTANVYVGRAQSMLAWAVRTGVVGESPIRHIVRLPAGEAYQVCRRRAMTDDEIARFIAAVEQDDRDQAARIAAARTIRFHGRGVLYASRRRSHRVPQALFWRGLLELGMRYGEARALMWADVDLDDLVVTLRPEVTKTKRARQIPIRAEYAALLEQLREAQALVLRRRPSDSDCVFMSPEGRPLPVPTNNARRILDRLLKAAGIAPVDANGRKVDLHSLRGTCASRLARRGVALPIAQRLLGHADVATTARFYVRLGVEDLREAMERANESQPQRVPGRARIQGSRREPATV